ncbi:MAG: hypothetical protein HWD62_10625 [Cyclobacteriaceae bacterium]|nr:MAG: hypothetical protein HWD62_10625 [Cyclobacteriaceae bacterium]
MFCGDQLQASYYNNPSGCKNDRTVSIRAYTSFTVAGSFYTPNLISEAWGMKRNWLCNWSHYETKLQTRDSWINVYMRIESSLGDGIYFVYDFPDYNGANDEYEHILFQGNMYAAIERLGGPVPDIGLYRIHEEASSAGVGSSNWAIINCTWAPPLF